MVSIKFDMWAEQLMPSLAQRMLGKYWLCWGCRDMSELLKMYGGRSSLPKNVGALLPNLPIF